MKASGADLLQLANKRRWPMVAKWSALARHKAVE